MSPYGFRWTFASSGCCWWLRSNGGAADDGAVETALWREDVSVEAVLVVLEDPLPLNKRIRLALQNGQGQRQGRCPESDTSLYGMWGVKSSAVVLGGGRRKRRVWSMLPRTGPRKNFRTLQTTTKREE